MTGEKRIEMPPLRPYEDPTTPVTALPIPPETDTFVVDGECPDADDLRSMPRPVSLPPLRPDEEPGTAVRVLAAVPDPALDGPEWGNAKRVPEIRTVQAKLLRPWDD
ncbi:MAG: hypothetical protein GX651_00490 [Methanomicrobiales archaeon]|nr:hypothetical protein [Methanomicrobiales archaeon]